MSLAKDSQNVVEKQADTFPNELHTNLQQLLTKYDINEIQHMLNALTNTNQQLKTEPILNPENRKFTAFPLQYQNIWNKYKIQMASFWKAEEIDFSSDYEDFMTLNENEQHFIEMILAFFAASDGIVNFNLSERFIKEIQTTEIIFTYQYQAMMENIHCVSGDTLLLTSDGYEKIEDICNMSKKVWNGKQYSETVVQFTGIQELYRVELSNGLYLDCTDEHKWFINNGAYPENEYGMEINTNKSVVFTKNLKVGDLIKGYYYPQTDIRDNNNHNTFNVPLNQSCYDKMDYLNSLFKNDNKFWHEDINYLRIVQLLISTVGNFSYIDYDDIYNNYRLLWEKDNYKTDINKLSIKSVTHLRLDKTYCFNEKLEHAGMFNGILTGQSEVYSLMLDNIVKNEDKKNNLFNAISTIPSIKELSDWAFKWIESSKSFAHRVVAFVIVEGLFFQGPFAALFWLKKYKNKTRNTTKTKPFMCGLMDSNKFIARDEGQHTLFGCDVYNLLVNKLSAKEIDDIFAEAVPLAKTFMKESIPVELIGMNYNKMSQYIEYIADRLLLLLNYKKMFNTTNPFKFMETIGLNDKTNFFEKRPTEYQDSHVMNKGSKTNVVIKDDDF